MQEMSHPEGRGLDNYALDSAITMRLAADEVAEWSRKNKESRGGALSRHEQETSSAASAERKGRAEKGRRDDALYAKKQTLLFKSSADMDRACVCAYCQAGTPTQGVGRIQRVDE